VRKISIKKCIIRKEQKAVPGTKYKFNVYSYETGNAIADKDLGEFMDIPKKSNKLLVHSMIEVRCH
jgi:hypothetical protein